MPIDDENLFEPEAGMEWENEMLFGRNCFSSRAKSTGNFLLIPKQKKLFAICWNS